MTFLRHNGDDGKNFAFPTEQDKYWNEEKRPLISEATMSDHSNKYHFSAPT